MIAALLAVSLGASPFTDFLRPVSLPGAQPAAACTGCHRLEGEQWEKSRHKSAMTNAIFLEGFAAEPHRRCVNCHAPLEEQARDVRRNHRALVDRRSSDGLGIAHEGITCVTCHLRDGGVTTSRPNAEAVSHPVAFDPSLGRSDGCAACHEFLAHEVEDGRTRVVDEPMQTTFSEWQRWAAGGGQGTCQSCHMPDGSHALRGAFDLEWMRASIRLEVAAGFATIRPVGVGHRFPTGDVMRHLVLWADGVELARFGKQGHQRLAGDTSLEPDVEVRVRLPPHTSQVRLTYHRTEDSSPLPREDVVVTLATRAIRAR